MIHSRLEFGKLFVALAKLGDISRCLAMDEGEIPEMPDCILLVVGGKECIYNLFV